MDGCACLRGRTTAAPQTEGPPAAVRQRPRETGAVVELASVTGGAGGGPGAEEEEEGAAARCAVAVAGCNSALRRSLGIKPEPASLSLSPFPLDCLLPAYSAEEAGVRVCDLPW
ncbi:hypothetical protein CDD83_4654 [Cordyceps sp. RAO-2017]|nr:hypothetical protein CDD83_4654 [Cordyceps sp. RAO-2017]